VICSREAQEKNFCDLHYRAYQNIKEKFEVWMKASDVEWGIYLHQLQKNSLTGEWAKEVAKYLIREEEKDVQQDKKNI
jgi:tRNA pseudouridine-54 N-methylase